jgi:hypothetical protein
MNSIRFDSKDRFIAAIESRREFWQAYDADLERRHKEAEKEWLAAARATMLKAVKWDYDTLKKNLEWGDLKIGRPPECPVLETPRLGRVLAALRYTTGTSFTVDSGGVWSEAHHVLTHDPYARTKVC